MEMLINNSTLIDIRFEWDFGEGIDRAGLRSDDKEQNVTVHDLCRTIASWSVMRGGNIQTTSKLLGHSDISITASTYAHLDIEHVRAELGITTAQLLGTDLKESKVDRLINEIEQLSVEERRELLRRIDSTSPDLIS